MVRCRVLRLGCAVVVLSTAACTSRLAAAPAPCGCARATPAAGAAESRAAIASSSRPRFDAHGSLHGFLATHFSPTAWRDYALRDMKDEGALRLPIALGIAAVAVRPFDQRLVHHIPGPLGGNETIGTYAQGGLVGVSVLLGALHPREGRTARDETWTQVESFALTYGLIEGLKPLVHRQRPDLSNLFSFPSAHTSAAFCAATLIQRNSGPVFGLPAYAIASAIGFSRVEAKRHFPSDVLAGAAVGTAVATLIDGLHFGDGSPGEGISSRLPFDVGIATAEDGRPELCLSFEF